MSLTLALCLVALTGLLGGLWRRWLGGWITGTPGDRLTKFAVMVLLCWPLVLVLPWWGAVLATMLVGLHWAKGHQLSSMPQLWLRYGPWGVAYLTRYWWPAGWVTVPRSVFIDGHTAIAEILIGFLVFLSLGIACLVGPLAVYGVLGLMAVNLTVAELFTNK